MTVHLSIPVEGPFRLDLTVWALRRRPGNVIDQWTNREYSRLFAHERGVITATVSQRCCGPTSDLAVTLTSRQPITDQLGADLRLGIEQMLGVKVDLRGFYSLVHDDPDLQPLVARFRGVRPPRFPSMFEALLNSIACQQLSLDSGLSALNRLSGRFGASGVMADRTRVAFPRPVDLLGAPAGVFRELGFSHQKERAIAELALGIAAGTIDLSALETMTNDEAIASLSSIRGIGRWSSEYVLLRGLGRLEIFPADDVGAQNNLQRLFGLDAKPDYATIKALVSRWSPYQGLVYFHLLLDKLHAKGTL